MIALGPNRTANGKIEKELGADIYTGRNGHIGRAVFHSYLHQGDKGILDGQPARAGLTAWPHIFSFCGGSHQLAAARALEDAWRVSPPPNALLLRAIAQAAEALQNATRWFYTAFGPSLANDFFAGHSLYNQARERFTAFKGSAFRQGMMAGALPTALYALFAGQWPYADFIIPGGVNTRVQAGELARAFALIDRYRSEWLETAWLGCPVERYLDIHTWEGLLGWLDEKAAHRDSSLGLFIRTALDYGLDKTGGGPGHYLAYGAFPGLEGENAENLWAAQLHGGFLHGDIYRQLCRETVLEMLDTPADGPHFQGEAVEAGPLARLAVAAAATAGEGAGHPLLGDILRKKGASTFTRALARMHEAALYFYYIRHWLSELVLKGPFTVPVEACDGIGIGLAEAPRGALAHYVELEGGLIKSYRILSPTILNIQAGNSVGKESPLAFALKGAAIRNLEKPFEVGLVARSFDACLACNVRVFKSLKGQLVSEAQV
ncbi:MAG: nickel-dependent hydrogenase large subunit [Phaeodactylibacter sp.]|nr:nickel-dependent hydrogenase large subunit [Phaeodactylibacter sp.]MCB9275163.1 nickel-dependent hydrogenase large subunit [Lewinellaceae bacterium]